MPTPFSVRDQDDPTRDLGEWTEDGDIRLPGNLIVGGEIVGPTGVPPASNGITGWLNAKAFGARGDGVTDDSAAIQRAIDAATADGGTVYLPPATYLVATPLVLKTRVRLCGDVEGKATLLTLANDLFAIPTAFTELVEVDHLRLDVTGGHVFNGFRYARCHFHHLQIHQRSSDKSILAGTVTLLTTCYFTDSVGYVYGATRTVPGINLNSAGVDLLTENVFDRLQLWNADNDNTQYMIHIRSSHATSLARNNTFRNIVFEQCHGGGILAESLSGTLLEGCYCWDCTTTSIKADFFSFVKNATNASGCQATTFLNCGRVGDGPDTGIQDINLDVNAVQTTIIGFSARGTGVVPRIDLAASLSSHIIGLQASSTVTGTAGAGYVSTEPGALTVRSGVDANMVQVVNDLAGGNVNAPAYRYEGATSGSLFFTSRVTGDTTAPFVATARGSLAWGSGAATRDVTLSRGAANRLDLTTADLRVVTAGRGLQVAEGSNAKMGTATLNGTTTVTVSTTAVTANSRILLTTQAPGGTVGSPYVFTRSAGTSFGIRSTDGADTSTVAWMIVEPA